MLLFAFVLMLAGWMLIYAGIKNRSLKGQLLWAFGYNHPEAVVSK